MSNCKVTLNLENSFSEISSICSAQPGSILGPLLFLIYINDMMMAVKCSLFLYADDTCLVFQSKNVKNIRKQFNEDFGNVCNWIVDNLFNTKSVLLTSQHSLILIMLAQHVLLVFLKNYETKFKLHKINAFVSFFS